MILLVSRILLLAVFDCAYNEVFTLVPDLLIYYSLYLSKYIYEDRCLLSTILVVSSTDIKMLSCCWIFNFQLQNLIMHIHSNIYNIYRVWNLKL